MTQVTSPLDSDLIHADWLSELDALAFAYGKPKVSARIKSLPEHFLVTERMEVEPSGEGEHYWLDITKTCLNTDAVAKSLARFSGVANRDVGYSGMKDFHAVTRQWFSVWRPKGDALDWSQYEHQGVVLNQVAKHNRKIKRGTHCANHFQIRLTDLAGLDSNDIEQALDARLTIIQESGVPNYYGAQRFGRGAKNLSQALTMFAGKRRFKDRNLRSILLSSARSWLFNQVVSARIKARNWQSLYIREPANLDGNNSVFIVEDPNAEEQRLSELDIHPTAPLWGRSKPEDAHTLEINSELIELEQKAMEAYRPLQEGLESAGLDYQRRALRLAPKLLEWEYEQEDLCLSFELQRGQFATSILRELVLELK